MENLKQVSSLIFTSQCYNEYFVNFNILDVPCFKATLSKCLGLIIILGSLPVKVPQIIKIYKSKSGQGINTSSVSLELAAVTIYMSYCYVNGFPFTAWGNTIFIAIQTVLIRVQVIYYGGAPEKALAYILLYLVVCFILMGGITPADLLWTLQGINIPILATGKLMQAYTNFKNGHTGQLSAITLFMLFFGSLARIFTSVQETGDPLTIVTYVVVTSANFVLVYQLLYYWNVDITKEKKIH